MSFKDVYQEKVTQINNALIKFTNKIPRQPLTLFKAIDYSLNNGGKRFRPVLLISAHELMEGDIRESLPIACGIEMIHTYSLIHDDLPSMDNDDYRRGLPANHKVFGEAIAILTGDALLNMGYEIMLSNAAKYSQKLSQHIKAIKIVADAAGSQGMIAGQVFDLESEDTISDEKVLKCIHQYKTGALITASLLAGIVLENPSSDIEHAIITYGRSIGLAFQITDDILDITGDLNTLGKKPGSDQENCKMTFPKIYGLEHSKKTAYELIDNAVDAIQIFGSKADFLKDLAYYVVKRLS